MKPLPLLKSIILIASALTLEWSGTALAQEPIEQKYDRFKDSTSIRLKLTSIPRPGAEEAWLSAEFGYSGQTPTRPDKVILGLVFASTAAQFRQSDELIVLCDGRRLNLGPMYREAQYDSTKRNRVREVMAALIPREVFIEMAQAKHVEAKLGHVEFSFSEDNMALLKAFIDRIPR